MQNCKRPYFLTFAQPLLKAFDGVPARVYAMWGHNVPCIPLAHSELNSPFSVYLKTVTFEKCLCICWISCQIFSQVNLGVIMENENTAECILKAMHYMHKYVPGHGPNNLTQIISAGDLMTSESESSCQEEQQNSSSPSSRFEGLMPVIADFHSYANFLEVSW